MADVKTSIPSILTDGVVINQKAKVDAAGNQYSVITNTVAVSGNVGITNTDNHVISTLSAATLNSNSSISLGLGQSVLSFGITNNTTLATISFQASFDNVTWFPINGVVPSTGLLLPASSTVSFFAQCDVSGYQWFRLIVTTISAAATINVYMNASVGTSNVSLDTPLPSGTNNIGSVSLNPGINNVGSIQISDATTSSQRASVNTSGQLAVSVGSLNLTEIGGVAVTAQAQGIQPAAFIPTQEIVNTGRSLFTMILDPNVTSANTGVAGTTTETLISMAINVIGIITTATSYTVPVGNVLRIQSITTHMSSVNNININTEVRLRAIIGGGTLTITSPLYYNNITSLNNLNSDHAYADISDGMEFPAGAVIGFTQISSGTAVRYFSINVIGFLY